MRDQSAAPTEFVSYIDRRLHTVESAALRLTTDDMQAERMAQELMTLIAIRWRRLARADTKHDLALGSSADVYLTELFRQEAGELGYPDMHINLESRVPARGRSLLSGRLPSADEAGLIWDIARGRVRRRILIAGGAGVLAVVIALCQSRAARESPSTSSTPLTDSTDLPRGASILPAGPFSFKPISRVPQQLALPAQKPPAISSVPLDRAVLLVAATGLSGLPVYALGDNETWRLLDSVPSGFGRAMAPGCLSPDGKFAAFNSPDGALLLDLSTGHALPLPQVRTTSEPVWLTERRVLLSDSALADRATGAVIESPVGPDNALAIRAGGREDLLIELLSAGQPLTAPARVRRWTLVDGVAATIPLSGSPSGLVGTWESAGFGVRDERAVRLCRPTGLPDGVNATSMAAVLSPRTAEVAQALLFNAVSGAPTLLGWDAARRVLLALVKGNVQEIVGWDPVSGEIGLVCTLNFHGRLSLRDLSTAA